MPTYIALLRGINVSGQKLIRMEDLRTSISRLKYQNVRTYIQSGNILFSTTEKSSDTLSKKIRARILKDFGFSVAVIVVSKEDIEKIVKNSPFKKEKSNDLSKLYVTFLASLPEKSNVAKMNSYNSKEEQFLIRGKTIYLNFLNGYGKAKLSNTAFEKILLVEATTRNWNTVNKLLELTSDAVPLSAP